MNVFQFALEDEFAVGDFLSRSGPGPCRMALASSLGTMPSVASMRTCALEPARSSPASRLSKSMEGVISLMIAAGPVSNRPPHILFAVIAVSRQRSHAEPQPAYIRRCRPGGLGRSIWDRGRLSTQSLPCPRRWPRKPRRPPCPKRPLLDASGGKHSIGDFKGKYVLVNLWATWCAPCVSELPSLVKLQAAVPGLKVLAVDVGHDKTDKAAAFLKDHKADALGTLCRYRTGAAARLRRLWLADHGADRSQRQGSRQGAGPGRMERAAVCRVFQESDEQLSAVLLRRGFVGRAHVLSHAPRDRSWPAP